MSLTIFFVEDLCCVSCFGASLFYLIVVFFFTGVSLELRAISAKVCGQFSIAKIKISATFEHSKLTV